ncbi:MAG: CPBP family intramembrane metalloprotease [Chloroflexi bacterium]|nr:CPBP family intramembrane metalloprotease [Chloroflexota bacterium]
MIRQILVAIARPQQPPPWSVIYAALITIGAFAAVIIGTTIVTLFGEQTPFRVVLAWVIGLTLIALYLTLTRNRTAQDGAALGITQAIGRWPLILLLSFGAGAALDLVSLLATGTPSVVAEFTPLFNPFPLPFGGDAIPTWILAGLLMVVFQPVAEGLVFRGVAYPALRATLGPVQGFLITALWYGIFHLVAYSTPGGADWIAWWYTLILPVLAGIYIGAVRAVTGSTRASMFAQAGLGMFFFVRALTLVG